MPSTRDKLLSLFINLQVFFSDLILLSAGLSFLAQLYFVALILSILIIIIRSTRRGRKSKIVSVIYGFLAFLTIDTALLISYMAVYSRGIAFFLLPLLVYALVLYLRKRTGLFYYLSPVQLVLVLFFCYGVLTISPFDSAGLNCRNISDDGRARIITDPGVDSLPMFIIDRPENSDVLVGYKLNPSWGRGDRVSLKTVTPETGEEKTWLLNKRVLGLLKSHGGDVYAIVGRAVKSDPHMMLIRFSANGEIIGHYDMKLPRSSYARCILIERANKIILVTEDRWFSFDTEKNELEKLDEKEINGGAPVYFASVDGDKAIMSFSSSYLLISYLTGRKNLMTIDLEKMKLEKYYQGSLCGYYGVKHIPNTDLFAVAQAWLGGGAIFDIDLNMKRELDIPAGVREIEVSGDGSLLYAGNYYDGYVHVIDIESDTVVDKYFVGKAVRDIEYTDDGRILVGTKCGVVEITP